MGLDLVWCPPAVLQEWLSPGRLVDIFLWRPDFLTINVFILVLFATPFSVAVQG